MSGNNELGPDPSAMERLLLRLDDWRHLPAYRLEPRVDVILSLYLPDILSKKTGEKFHLDLIPEFPLRRGSIWGPATVAQDASVKVDFAAMTMTGRLHFVEFKTDMASIRPTQNEYLRRVAELPVSTLVQGVLDIVEATHPKYLPKYRHLLLALKRWELIECDGVLLHLQRGYEGEPVPRLLGVEVIAGDEPPVVWIIQPEAAHDERTIGFDQVCMWLDEVADDFSAILAQRMLQWIKEPG